MYSNAILCLEKMGYGVELNERHGFYTVSLETSGGYRVSLSLSYEDLKLDWVVEGVVSRINRLIVRDL